MKRYKVGGKNEGKGKRDRNIFFFKRFRDSVIDSESVAAKRILFQGKNCHAISSNKCVPLKR